MIFSVIVPVHNAGKYIEELLSSIDDERKSLEGSLSGGDNSNPGFELLLMENGSTDNSAELCRLFSENHSYAKSFELGPVGAYNARREGIRRAKGDYLVFADADDLLAKDMLISLKAALSQFKASPDILLYNAAMADAPKEPIFSFPFDRDRLYEGAALRAFYEVMCSNDSLNALWNKCVKRETALAALEDGEFDNLNHGEDLIQTSFHNLSFSSSQCSYFE